MKNIRTKLILASVLAAATFTTGIAEAQSTLHVPFSFHIGSSVLPAGTYSVEPGPHNGFVTLTNTNNSVSFSWTLLTGEPAPSDTRIVLRFDQVGNSHMLRSVQYRSLITARLDKKALQYQREAFLPGQAE